MGPLRKRHALFICCAYLFANCKAKMERKHIEHHVEANYSTHTRMMITVVLSTSHIYNTSYYYHHQ